LKWKKMDAFPLQPAPGALGVTVLGDPGKDGDYAKFMKCPAHFAFPMHWYTNDVYVAMIRGSMSIRREGKSDAVIKEGGFFYLPSKLKSIAACDSDCRFLVWGSKVFDIFYVSQSDDPYKETK
jgi:hypothetical protein